MVRQAAISIRVEDRVKEALVKAAEAEGRTLSQYVERLLIAHLKQLKLLK